MQFWAYINTKKSKVEGEAQGYMCFWPHLLQIPFSGHKFYKNKTRERAGKLGSTGTCVWGEAEVADAYCVDIRHGAEVIHPTPQASWQPSTALLWTDEDVQIGRVSWLSSYNQNQAEPDWESSSVWLQNPFYYIPLQLLKCWITLQHEQTPKPPGFFQIHPRPP